MPVTPKTFSAALFLSLTGLALIVTSGCRQGDAAAQPAADGHADQSNAADAVAVDVIRPERATLRRTTTQPATLHANFEAELHAKVSGYLRELKVDIGARVSENEVLATLWIPEMDSELKQKQAAAAQAEAEVAQAAAALEQARAEVASAQANLEEKRAERAEKRAELDFASSELKRYEGLVAASAARGELLDRAKSQFQAAQATMQSVEARIRTADAHRDAAEAAFAKAQADQKAAEARYNVAAADIEYVRTLMRYAEIKAPFDGLVTDRHVDPGDLVRNTQNTQDSGRPPLFRVSQIDWVRVRVPVPEDDAPWVDVRDPVTLRLRSMPGQVFPGNVSRLASRIEDSTRTMLVEIDMKNPDHRLLPGMYGEATITLAETENALVLPAGAVRYDEQGRSFVYTLDENDSVQVVEVETSYDDGNRIGVLGGVDENTRVIDTTFGRLEAGQPVRVNAP